MPPASLSTSRELTPRLVKSRLTITIGTLFFSMSLQQVGFVEYPTCDHDHTLGSPLQDHLQVVVEEPALGLRVHHEGKIAGRLQTRLNPAHDWDAVRVRKIVG